MSDAGTSMEHVVDPHMSDHPTPRKYVNIAIILAIVTALEVAVYYVTMPDSMLITVLAIMAIIKFVMVVAYFMHLRFDSRIFRRLFVTGVILAFFVFGVVMVLFFSRGGPAPGVGG
ncbi:MAG TPA: cytochrome C oxidase subunit IV family protein [Actinomycetota bacterium]|nr:cytochrome C oxidase subunit IV family protein [Actinomycetota bacterium]